MITPLTPALAEALAGFLGRLGADDHTFLSREASEPGTAWSAARAWASHGPGSYLVSVDAAGNVNGFCGVTPGGGWSSHVGRLRLVVDPAARGRGLGAQLAFAGLVAALDAGLTKITVEVRADQVAVLHLFHRLGFQPEAVLADHVRSPDGSEHDLVLLAHRAEDVAGLVRATGLAEITPVAQ